MIYIGAFIVIFAAFSVWRCYSSFLLEELDCTRAFLGALSDYREKMKCYLRSPVDWAKDYLQSASPIADFLGRVRDGELLITAYTDSREGYYLPKNADEVLKSCFSRLGEGYLETELEVIEGAVAELSQIEKGMADEIGKRQRASGALLGAFAVGLVILVL
jgi:hypothetical protein